MRRERSRVAALVGLPKSLLMILEDGVTHVTGTQPRFVTKGATERQRNRGGTTGWQWGVGKEVGKVLDRVCMPSQRLVMDSQTARLDHGGQNCGKVDEVSVVTNYLCVYRGVYARVDVNTALFEE